MPNDLLSVTSGIPSSILESINITPNDVLSGKNYLGSDGEIHSGTLSFSGNAGTGDVVSGKTFYSNSTVKQTGTLVYDKMSISKTLDTLQSGDYQTKTHSQAVKAGETWLFVTSMTSSYTSGAASSISSPSGKEYLNIYQNVHRSGFNSDKEFRYLRILLKKFTASGTVSASIKMTQGYAGCYFMFCKIATS